LRTLIIDPKQRPHQMHLTGDQIYADEGAPELLEIISKLSGELLGNQAGACFEKVYIDFPKSDRYDGVTEEAETIQVPVDIANLAPSKRTDLMSELAGFGSGSSDS